MGLEAWATLAVVGLLVAALASNRMGADTALLAALVVLMLIGVLPPDAAIRGFAHPAVIMIAGMFVIACGLGETGAFAAIANRLLGMPRTPTGAQVRLMAPVAVMSAFMNNTPIVAIYLPIVSDWARKLRLSPSHLYMPLSFAAILGGMCTLIGTSTNIMINNLYVGWASENAAMLDARFGLAVPGPTKQFWWMAAVGAPIALAGLATVALTARRLLPERRTPLSYDDAARRYTVELMVEPAAGLVGKSIEQAGLRHLPGLYLSEIERDGNVLPAVGPEERLEAHDRLVFVGVLDSVLDLLRIRGLVPATDQVHKVDVPGRQRSVVEAVVSRNSPLVRRSVRESKFRTRYNAAIIAVHRGGEQLKGKIGDIVLQPGDTLLLSTHAGFADAYRNSDHFYLISTLDEAREIRHDRAWVALAILGLVVALLTLPFERVFEAVGLQQTALHEPMVVVWLGATLMVLTRCCTGTLARRSIDWQVLLVVGAAIGLGEAMMRTGAAQGIADAIFAIVRPGGPYALLLAVAIVTSVFTQLMSNAAAAVLMFPIAVAAALDAGVSPEPFVVTLMVAAAGSFLTPIGYQTNLMVAGPGGYRFADYLRLGLPLTILVAVMATVIAPLAFPFQPGTP